MELWLGGRTGCIIAAIFLRMKIMIDFYYWTTPNGHKVSIFLEEAGLAYNVKPINISKDEQFAPAFLKVSPNNKIPAIVDHEPTIGDKPVVIFESGAILTYLAEKTSQFLPLDVYGRFEVMEWLFWQVGGLGPMAGQVNHFMYAAPEKIPYAVNRYVKETTRLFTVLNKQLENRDYIAGEYSIADMACYPWVRIYERLQQDISQFPNVKHWLDIMEARPAVERAYALVQKMNG